MLIGSLFFLLLALVVSAFFSGSETAVMSLNRFKLEHLEHRGEKRAGVLKRLRQKPERFLATVLVANTFVNAAAASLATFLFALVVANREESVLLATATATFFLLVFSEIIPKTFASQHPERVALVLYGPILAVMGLLKPFVFVVTKISRAFLRLLRVEPGNISDGLSEDEYRSILKVGAEEGTIAQTKRRMLTSIFDISQKTVKEVMIPRPKATMIELHTPPAKTLETVVGSGFSRFPVYGEHEENIVGVVHSKDLLGLLQKGEQAEISKVLRKPFFIPASARVETALSEFQKAKVHMGIVVDEYGGFDGLVTIEDLIEEIVGEIQDEHDEETDYIKPQADGSCLVDGGTAIYKINERLGLKIPENESYSTLAGFLLAGMGHIPKEREFIEHEGRRYIAEKVARRTIAMVRLQPGLPANAETAPNSVAGKPPAP